MCLPRVWDKALYKGRSSKNKAVVCIQSDLLFALVRGVTLIWPLGLEVEDISLDLDNVPRPDY